jgi:hypothetical protein
MSAAFRWRVTPCSLVDTDISENLKIKIEVPVDGWSSFLQISQISARFTSQKNVMFIVSSFPDVVQTGSEVHPTSYPMGTGVSFPGREADHSSPTSAEVKTMWIYTSTPPYAFMA